MKLFRVSRHPLVRWWWRIDRVVVVLILLLMVIAAAVSMTASSAVAASYHVDPYYFARRQALFLSAALPVMFVNSLLSPRGVRNVGTLLYALAFAGVVATIAIGADVKGSQRWIDVGAFRLQPSEFVKPAFAIVTAWLLSGRTADQRLVGFLISIGLLGAMGILYLMQPDFGMFMITSLVWFGQMFLANLSPILLIAMMALVAMSAGTGYLLLPHVRSRVSRFLDPASGDSYQVDQAREAFLSGGLFGRGPGEGIVKHSLPDVHTDFVFAVIGEEFGIIACSLIVLLYVVIVVRCFSRLLDRDDRFTLLAGSGLLLLFSLQTIINMAVALNLMPTTGMTLPFISYGGSSTLSLAILVGFLLALTRKGGEGEKRVQKQYRRRFRAR